MSHVQKNMRIVLAGGVSSTRRTLQGLLRHQMNVVGVLGLSPKLAQRTSGYTRMDDLLVNTRVEYAEFENINAPEVIQRVKEWEPDLFFVVGLSQMVKSELLSVPHLGCVGFHPTRLPEGRGRAPIAWMILENRSGAATFFLMNEGVDAGPILVQEPFEVVQQDYAFDVVAKMEAAIDRALDRWLPQLCEGHWNPTPQDDSLATYYGRRAPTDGLINWYDSAENIMTLIRAASRPHPGAYFYVKDEKVIVWKAEIDTVKPVRGVVGRVLEITDKGYLIQTGNGLIWLTEIECVNKQTLSEIRVGTLLMYNAQEEIYRLKKKLETIESKFLGGKDAADES